MTANTRVRQGWDDEADIVVVGFGGAGACAALEAAQNGAAVMALDRYHGGGATAASGAIVYAGGGTPFQQAAGHDDTPEEMYRYLKLEVGEAVSDSTLRRFCNESPGNIAWLEEAGVPFEASLCPFKTSYPTDDYYLYFSGNELVLRYEAQAKPAPRGHRAKGPGISGLTLYHALEKAALRCLRLGTPGDDGAGIRLGESRGGATARMDRISAWRFYVPPDVLVQGVLVNKQGERICNEDLYGATLGD